MLEKVWPDHAIRYAIAITKLPIGHNTLTKKKKKIKKKKNNNKKVICDSIFLWIL